MNSILMVVGALIIIIVVLLVFSQDDPEEEEQEVTEGNSQPSAEAASATEPGDNSAVKATSEPASVSAPAERADTTSATAAVSAQIRPVSRATQSGATSDSVQADVGGKEDFELRLRLHESLPGPTDVRTRKAVVAVAQLRFPEDVLQNDQAFLPLLAAAESVLDPEQAPFDYAQFPANQLDRLWLFNFDEERDDPVLEALFVSFDAISRFKKNLESQPQLAQARARLSIGLALGPVTRFVRGALGQTTLAGKTVYLAETLAEAAGDFQIYIDQEIHHLAQPLFDFREWKPMKLRPILPQLSFFEVVGLNKREEIFAFASHKEAAFRQAVAISYRYLEMSDVTPLLSLVTDSDERVAMEALKTVAFLGDQRAQGILKKYLSETKNANLRSAVIEALSATGKEDIVPLLLAATKDVHWQVRFKAAQGLYSILHQDGIKHLAPLRQDDDGAVRSAIHEIYFKETGDRSEVQALGNLLTDLSVRARKAAMEALARIGNDEAMQLLAQSFRQQDNDLRKAMVRIVANSRTPASYASLLKMFAACDEQERMNLLPFMRRARSTS